MSSISDKYANYWYVKHNWNNKHTDRRLRDYWFIRGAKSLDMTEDELRSILKLSKQYERIQLRFCNEPMDEEEHTKNEKKLDKIIEKTIELTEAHNAIKGNKKILIAHYSIFALRVYALSDYTKATHKRYSRRKFNEIHEWLFCHSREVCGFYD